MTTTTPPNQTPPGPMKPPGPRSPRYRADGVLLCSASRSHGGLCNAPAVKGTTVCRVHGGMAPQVQRKARLRLLDMIDPALATIAREMVNPNASPQARLRAAENVLDRAGFPRHLETGTDEAKALLVQRLIQLRQTDPTQPPTPPPTQPTQTHDVIEGSVDEEDS